MTANQVNGIILKKISGFYYVQDEKKNLYECKLRGKLKEQVLTGDRVRISILDNEKGVLEQRLPRDNELYRPKIANVTSLIIVIANDRPAPSIMLLEKLLFLAYYNHLTPYIVLNKCDIPASSSATMIKDYYAGADFNFITCSAKTGYGIDTLKKVIDGQVAVMAGPSGSGKSTLLNTLLEGLNVRTQEVSHKIGRGKHTTRHVELFALKFGGCIADTPGFSVLDMPSLSRNEVAAYYPDFAQYIENCEFYNCLHYKERLCGVKQAVDSGDIPEFRYKNYISILEEVMTNERCY